MQNMTCAIAMSSKKEKAPSGLPKNKPDDAPYFCIQGRLHPCFPCLVMDRDSKSGKSRSSGLRGNLVWFLPMQHSEIQTAKMRLQRRHRTGLAPVSLFTGPERPTLIPQHSLRHTGRNCQYQTHTFCFSHFTSPRFIHFLCLSIPPAPASDTGSAVD